MKKEKNMTQEVLPMKETLADRAVAIKEQANAMASTMSDLGISAQDLTIPRVMLMQNTSEQVGDGKAKLGDLVNSQTNVVIGSITTPVDIIPLRMRKTLRVYDVSGSHPKLRRVEPLSPVNEKLSFEGNEDGVEVKRYLTMNFLVLLTSDVAKGEDFPHEIWFKSTGLQAGKKLATQLFKMAATGKLPYSQTVKLGASKQKKETNTYATFEIAPGVTTTANERAAAEKWLGVLSSVTYRVDDSEADEAVNTMTETARETVSTKVLPSVSTATPDDLY